MNLENAKLGPIRYYTVVCVWILKTIALHRLNKLFAVLILTGSLAYIREIENNYTEKGIGPSIA